MKVTDSEEYKRLTAIGKNDGDNKNRKQTIHPSNDCLPGLEFIIKNLPSVLMLIIADQI